LKKPFFSPSSPASNGSHVFYASVPPPPNSCTEEEIFLQGLPRGEFFFFPPVFFELHFGKTLSSQTTMKLSRSDAGGERVFFFLSFHEKAPRHGASPRFFFSGCLSSFSQRQEGLPLCAKKQPGVSFPYYGRRFFPPFCFFLQFSPLEWRDLLPSAIGG